MAFSFTSAATNQSQGRPQNCFRPYVREGFLTPRECEDLMAMMAHGDIRDGLLSGGVAADDIRSAATCWIDLDTVDWLMIKLVRELSHVTQTAFPFACDGFDEGLQLLYYRGQEQGQQNFYDWHSDIGRTGTAASRKLTFLIQLSNPEDYTGGELQVNVGGDPENLQATRGTLIAFPAFVLHQVSPVTSGERYSFAAWVHGPAFV